MDDRANEEMIAAERPQSSTFKFVNEGTEAMLRVQKELLDMYDRASRDWLARLKSEAGLWTGLAAALATTSSVPDAIRSYQECISRRVEMAAADAQRLSNECGIIMQKINLTNGWSSAHSCGFCIVPGDITMTANGHCSQSQTEDESQAAVEGPDDGATLRLGAEELSVAKERVETGRVRISTRTHEREAWIDENLAHERVEIETIPRGLQIDAMPEVRQEGDITIVPVVEEVLVVERRLMLKEEVRITRVRTTDRHQEKVMLRYQEAVITRHQDDSGRGEATSQT